jgi:hypothetical protein
MRQVVSFLLAVALIGLVSAGRLGADEEKVPLDKLPKAVTEAVKKRFPKGEMTEAAKESENGKIVYEVTVKDGAAKYDVTVTTDGTITTLEKEIAVKDLPKEVTEAVEKKYPKATYKLAEAVIKVEDGKEKLSYYEVVVVTADKKTLEIEVSPDGTIKKEEKKDKDK